MSLEELDMLQEYQRSCTHEAEVDIFRLTEAIDRLTTNGKTRDGRQVIRSDREKIIDAMRKLHDLYVEVISPPVPSTIIHLDDLRSCRAASI